MVRFLRSLAPAIALSAALLAAPSAFAIDEDTRTLAQNQRGVEHLTQLADQLRALLRPEIGFPEEYVGAWRTSVDQAFAPDLLEADFLEAFDARLTDETRAAAMSFDTSALGQEGYRLLSQAEANRDSDAAVEAARQAVEGASPDQNALFTDLFAALQGPQKANRIMDAYYRIMKIGAEPVIGADAADEWIAGAGALRDQYVENYFLSSAAAFMPLEQQSLEELVTAVKDPVLVEYADQATLAFADALDAAADRLAIAYPEAIADR